MLPFVFIFDFKLNYKTKTKVLFSSFLLAVLRLPPSVNLRTIHTSVKEQRRRKVFPTPDTLVWIGVFMSPWRKLLADKMPWTSPHHKELFSLMNYIVFVLLLLANKHLMMKIFYVRSQFFTADGSSVLLHQPRSIDSIFLWLLTWILCEWWWWSQRRRHLVEKNYWMDLDWFWGFSLFYRAYNNASTLIFMLNISEDLLFYSFLISSE